MFKTFPHPSRRRSGPAGGAFASAIALALSTACLSYGSASASMPAPSSANAASSPTAPSSKGHHAKVIKIKVDPHLFGVHDYLWNSLRRPGTGSIRLWDSGTMWGDLFLTPDTPDWTRLDQAVSLAHANGTEITLVLGLTPSYAAADPSNPVYQTTMPNLAMYKSYVAAVMNRYKSFNGYRGIAAYQVWNEANITTFWNGTYDQLGQLVKSVHDVRDAVDPGAKVIGPAMVTRLPYQQKGISKFYKVKVGGQPVWKYVDAISLNLYPLDSYNGRRGTPEDSMGLLAAVKALLAADGVPATVPIWNTEVNYGMMTGAMGGHAAVPVPVELQAAYVMRTYLLNAARGIKRVDWYAYDLGDLPATVGGGPLGNTLMTDPSNRAAGALTPAGAAFTRIQQWMKGTLVGTATKQPCITDSHGTYTCQVDYRHGVGRIYWNPYRTAKVTLVKSATARVNLYGVTAAAKGGQRMKVDYAPVLIRSRS